jgi:hypothetical protein
MVESLFKLSWHWSCSCGAHDREGFTIENDAYWAAMRHRLSKDVRETHETELTEDQ